MRHPDGVWAGYTYEWNEAGTAATRVIGGKVRDVAGQAWIYPSDDQCLQCHTAAAGFTLGPTVSQLNGPFTYPSTNRIANQLATLEHINVFSEPLPGPPDTLPVLTNPADAGASLDDRARAYLETNCSQCHRPGGPTPSTMDLRSTTPLAATNTCNLVPQLGNLGLANARLIAPGDAAHSIIVARAGRRDVNGMPPTGSSLVDTAGVALLTSWITGLTSCP
jgi:mono/diheme cytochrome c family protein